MNEQKKRKEKKRKKEEENEESFMMRFFNARTLNGVGENNSVAFEMHKYSIQFCFEIIHNKVNGKKKYLKM